LLLKIDVALAQQVLLSPVLCAFIPHVEIVSQQNVGSLDLLKQFNLTLLDLLVVLNADVLQLFVRVQLVDELSDVFLLGISHEFTHQELDKVVDGDFCFALVHADDGLLSELFSLYLYLFGWLVRQVALQVLAIQSDGLGQTLP